MSDNSNLSQENKEIEQEVILPFEKDYEDVINDPNKMYFKYEEKIKKIINGLSYWKNFNKDELTQQAYIYFVEFTRIYDPYYNGNFIPFDKFLFKNLIIKLRSYIQRYYFKAKREQPTEFSEYTAQSSVRNNILEADDKIYNEYIYSLIPERQQKILSLSIDGYKQQEIGIKLDISQSRVSVIKSKTVKKLSEILGDNNNTTRKPTKKN